MHSFVHSAGNNALPHLLEAPHLFPLSPYPLTVDLWHAEVYFCHEFGF